MTERNGNMHWHVCDDRGSKKVKLKVTILTNEKKA